MNVRRQIVYGIINVELIELVPEFKKKQGCGFRYAVRRLWLAWQNIILSRLFVCFCVFYKSSVYNHPWCPVVQLFYPIISGVSRL